MRANNSIRRETSSSCITGTLPVNEALHFLNPGLLSVAFGPRTGVTRGRGQMNRGILKVLLLAALVALAIAGSTSGAATAGATEPAVIHPAGKGEFRGSVRHIPQG